MFYLYLKTHNTTGLNYLGQTIQNPFIYQGSGTRWCNHIKKHGYDVTTTVLYETPYIEEIKEQGLYYSDLWNIVESKEFANLCLEAGPEGGNLGRIITDKHKNIISKKLKGIPKSKEHIEKMRQTKKNSGVHKREKNNKAKSWIIISPENETYKINGYFQQFCEEHNIIWSSLIRYRGGKVPKPSSKVRTNTTHPKRYQMRMNTIGWTLL